MRKTFRVFYEDAQSNIKDELDHKNSSLPLSYTPAIYKFVPTFHAKARAHQHHPDIKTPEWQDLHQKVENHLNSIEKKDKKDGEHLFYSKSKNIGYVAAVNHKDKLVKIITVLQKNHQNTKEGTAKHLVESILLE